MQQQAASPSPEKVIFDDTFFVTGGGLAAPAEAGPLSNKHPLSRPRSTPLAYIDRGQMLQENGDSAQLFGHQTRQVRTADGSLGHRRLCFRSEPIGHLVYETLRSIDPSGVFNTYQEWAEVKNRVLSSEMTCSKSLSIHTSGRPDVVMILSHFLEL